MIDAVSRGRGMPRPYNMAGVANFYERRDCVFIRLLTETGECVVVGYP